MSKNKHEVNIQNFIGRTYQSTLSLACGFGDINHKALLSIAEIIDEEHIEYYFKVIVDSVCVITTQSLKTAINVYNKR